jgi:hypothetical protein
VSHSALLYPNAPRPFRLDTAALKLIEIANGAEVVQDGRIYIERINAPFLAAGGTCDDFRAGIERTIALGWYGDTRAARL